MSSWCLHTKVHLRRMRNPWDPWEMPTWENITLASSFLNRFLMLWSDISTLWRFGWHGWKRKNGNVVEWTASSVFTVTSSMLLGRPQVSLEENYRSILKASNYCNEVTTPSLTSRFKLIIVIVCIIIDHLFFVAKIQKLHRKKNSKGFPKRKSRKRETQSNHYYLIMVRLIV